MRATKGTRTVVAAIVAALLCAFAGAAYAAPVGTDFRVSNAGFDEDTRPGAFNPDVAYNSQLNQYLITWYGDGNNTFDYEIYGQIVDANGDEVGSDFQISNVDTPGNLARIGLDPAVAYNPEAPAGGEYLVIWYGDGLATDNEYEVWGQRVSATGTELGGDFRISNMGPEGSISRTALRDPEVIYNAQANEYMAVWSGNNMTFFEKYEIWGQRITTGGTEVIGSAETQCADSTDSDGDGLINDGCAANGAAETLCSDNQDNDLVGGTPTPDGAVNDGCPVNSDFRISNTGADNDPSRDADNPVVANSTSGEYMVAWYGNPAGAAGEYEIYGQVLNSSGAEVGTDFRISNVGVDGNGLREPGPVPPSIAYNSTNNQFLVAWYGNNLTAVDEYEIWGQLLSATGAESGGDFRISNVGTDGDPARDAFDPSVAYNSAGNEYLVAWYGDTGAKTEVCGQRISATGGELGADFRISYTGSDSDTLRGSFFPATTYNPQANEYLATWYGDGLATDDEFEVFARRLGTEQPCATSNGGGGPGPGPGPAPPPGPSPAPPPPGPKLPVVQLTVNGPTTQSLRTKVLLVRARCDQACSLTASASLSVPGASKTYRLKSVKRSLTAGKRVTLKLKLSAKTVRAARRALAKRKKVRATVSLRARDGAGGLRKSTLRIRLKR